MLTTRIGLLSGIGRYGKIGALGIALTLVPNGCRKPEYEQCPALGIPVFKSSGKIRAEELPAAELIDPAQRPRTAETRAFVRLCVFDSDGKKWAQNCNSLGGTDCRAIAGLNTFRVFLNSSVKKVSAFLLYFKNSKPYRQSPIFDIAVGAKQ